MPRPGPLRSGERYRGIHERCRDRCGLGEWAGHVLSGADPHDRNCLKAVPEIAKLMEDLGLEIPGPREREEGFDPQP